MKNHQDWPPVISQAVSAVQVVQPRSCASLSNDRPLSDESWTPDAGGSRKSSYEVRKFVH